MSEFESVSKSTFKEYRRTGVAEMRPYVQGEDLTGVSIAEVDRSAGSPKPGDMIARNPKNPDDQWLVAAKYFNDNFEPVDPAVGAPTLAPRRVYLWRAWNKEGDQICDCGQVNARDPEHARRLIPLILGGPHRHLVAEIQLEEIRRL